MLNLLGKSQRPKGWPMDIPPRVDETWGEALVIFLELLTQIAIVPQIHPPPLSDRRPTDTKTFIAMGKSKVQQVIRLAHPCFSSLFEFFSTVL